MRALLVVTMVLQWGPTICWLGASLAALFPAPSAVSASSSRVSARVVRQGCCCCSERLKMLAKEDDGPGPDVDLYATVRIVMSEDEFSESPKQMSSTH